MSMFDNYNNLPENYIPDNRVKFIEEPTDNFIIGGTCSYTFSFGIDAKDISKVEVIFKGGINVFTIKTDNDVNIESLDDMTYISTTLEASETSLANEIREMFVQVKFYLTSGSVLYSNQVELNVISTLDN